MKYQILQRKSTTVNSTQKSIADSITIHQSSNNNNNNNTRKKKQHQMKALKKRQLNHLYNMIENGHTLKKFKRCYLRNRLKNYVDQDDFLTHLLHRVRLDVFVFLNEHPQGCFKNCKWRSSILPYIIRCSHIYYENNTSNHSHLQQQQQRNLKILVDTFKYASKNLDISYPISSFIIDGNTSSTNSDDDKTSIDNNNKFIIDPNETNEETTYTYSPTTLSANAPVYEPDDPRCLLSSIFRGLHLRTKATTTMQIFINTLYEEVAIIHSHLYHLNSLWNVSYESFPSSSILAASMKEHDLTSTTPPPPPTSSSTTKTTENTFVEKEECSFFSQDIYYQFNNITNKQQQQQQQQHQQCYIYYPEDDEMIDHYIAPRQQHNDHYIRSQIDRLFKLIKKYHGEYTGNDHLVGCMINKIENF